MVLLHTAMTRFSKYLSAVVLLALPLVLGSCFIFGEDATAPEEETGFNPTGNSDIEGTVSFPSVSIPEGVTVTVTGDLVINVSGPIEIAGNLVGDCVAITVNGEDDVTITGDVNNACSEPPEAETPALTIVGDGDLTLTGGTITSSGAIRITNDPTLTDEDFADLGTAPAAGAAGSASARAQTGNCTYGDIELGFTGGARNGTNGLDGEPGEDGGEGSAR